MAVAAAMTASPIPGVLPANFLFKWKGQTRDWDKQGSVLETEHYLTATLQTLMRLGATVVFALIQGHVQSTSTRSFIWVQFQEMLGHLDTEYPERF